MAGKSSFEIESMIPVLDSLNISGKDSSAIVFEMSPDFKGDKLNASKEIAISDTSKGNLIFFSPSQEQIKSTESMTINSVRANLQGYRLLDLGHAQIKSMQLHIADSSAIILSGGALKQMNE